jgi:hypothetical protein
MKQSLKIFLQATAVVLAGLLLTCSSNKHHDRQSNSQIHHLVLLHTNDTNGHPLKFFQCPAPAMGFLRGNGCQGIREGNRNVVVLDGFGRRRTPGRWNRGFSLFQTLTSTLPFK